jgi:hypothetical protein
VHIQKLLFQLLCQVDFKRQVLGQPEAVALAEIGEVIWGGDALPVADVETALALSGVHELAELVRSWKPDDRVHVIGHDHEAGASGGEGDQFIVQYTEQDAFGLIVIEEASASVDAEC